MRSDTSFDRLGSLPFAALYTRPRTPRPTLPLSALLSSLTVSRLVVLGWSLLRLSLVARRGFDTECAIAAFVAAMCVLLVIKELLLRS